MSSFVVLVDACTVFSSPIRDTLFRAAEHDLYRLRLTDEIMEEVRQSLISKKGLKGEAAQYLLDKVKASFPDAFVVNFESLIPTMLNHEDDRHVLAAAVKCGAQAIVTQNLRHFPSSALSAFEIEAQSPDDFLVHLFYLDPELMIRIVKIQAGGLRKPPKTVLEMLRELEKQVPIFVGLVREQLK
jgi:PIN domain